MKLNLRYYGDPILREKAKPIQEITEEIRQLAHNMIETMLSLNGIGLAATQVGVLLRLFVSNVDYEDEQGEIHFCEPKVYINPVLSNPSHVVAERSEGCLSIPKLYVPVSRPLAITIEWQDLEGNLFKREVSHFLARNLMHETDHLNGVLTIDRLKGKRRTEVEPFLRRIKQHYYLQAEAD
jgi:peptide deformylase